METPPVISLEQLAGRSIEDVLTQVLHEGSLTVQFPDGEAVVIQPKSKLFPLPVLEGRVPQGWKEAIYPPVSIVPYL